MKNEQTRTVKWEPKDLETSDIIQKEVAKKKKKEYYMERQPFLPKVKRDTVQKKKKTYTQRNLRMFTSPLHKLECSCENWKSSECSHYEKPKEKVKPKRSHAHASRPKKPKATTSQWMMPKNSCFNLRGAVPSECCIWCRWGRGNEYSACWTKRESL